MKLNLKLLKRLYLIDHESGEEHDMISFILNYCYKIPNLKFSIDSENNLFVTKNTTDPDCYACVVAHMDTVQTFTSARELEIKNNVITAHYIKSGIQCGLNADDCNGILVALQLLEVMPNLKVVFTTKEESGGIGAEKASDNIEFFIDVKFLIQADRRGNNDLITHTNGIDSASSKFIEEITPIMEAYGYSENTGTFTDIGILADELQISGVNVSCGYYNEHTFRESCNIRELNNCLDFIHSILVYLDNSNEFFPIEKQQKYQFSNTNSKYDYGNYKDDSLDENIPCNKCRSFDCMHCKYNYYG